MLASERERLQEPLRKLKGVSEKRAAILSRLGLEKQSDLLFFYPRAYDDWTDRSDIESLRVGDVATVVAEVVTEARLQRRGKLSWVSCRIRQGKSEIQAVWFNQPWMEKRMVKGESYLFHGKLQLFRRGLSLNNPSFVETGEETEQGLQAVYRLTSGLKQSHLRQLVARLLDTDPASLLTDPLADALRRQHRLCSLPYALEKIHRPTSREEMEIARRRLAFEEIFLTRAALALLKEERVSHSSGRALATGEKARQGMEQLLRALPFKPTSAQMKAINDILRDLRRDQAMNRLLQGDVGSGKTLVAAFAMAYVAYCGGQSALMAPTSILAEQHEKTLKTFFAGSDIQVELLTGAVRAAERRKILRRLSDGESQVLVGTHAVLQSDLVFANLSLAITDEQHRFGVRQRRQLAVPDAETAEERSDEPMPHRLVMSATPIPRTLGMILYGDLDLSVLDEMPSGRRPVKTVRIRQIELESVYQQMREEIIGGGQIYVVCPLLEDSAELDLESAENIYKELSGKRFPEFSCAVIHGRLSAREKEKTMNAFYAGEIQILVSTTVIEVGIDHANANFILIMHAERFGLAQLHQLRGRVGRGARPGRCFLYSDSEEALAEGRLDALCRNHDGFTIAEEDLRLRGPGDFFGTRQHGLPEFRLLNLYEDHALVEEAGQAVEEILASPAHSRRREDLIEAISERYPELLAGLTL